ncbi:MAG: (deoxy)nucleoside triphosphate pyrophosphohydrolase [Bacteroidetes bacterium]|nr:MAG: (deoxy)nucleoside triphosphate pyrophosphohydrolase [Bacteroidota bacterium]
MLHVSAGILIKDDRVFLAQRPEGKQQAGYWEFPGGKIEIEENPETALVREFMEEFGVQIRVLRKFHENVHTYAGKAVKLYSFLVVHQAGTFALREHAALAWVPLSKLLTYRLAPADIPIAEKLVGSGI